MISNAFKKIDHPSGLPCLECNSGVRIVDALVAVGFAKSLREAKQFVRDGIVRVNGERI